MPRRRQGHLAARAPVVERPGGRRRTVSGRRDVEVGAARGADLRPVEAASVAGLLVEVEGVEVDDVEREAGRRADVCAWFVPPPPFDLREVGGRLLEPVLAVRLL